MNADRVFHQKFGNGTIIAIDGNKLTIQFDKAGQKRVVDSFVERASPRRKRGEVKEHRTRGEATTKISAIVPAR